MSKARARVRQRQLLINSLRMRPDRIIIGEVRGEEAFDMLQAMNTGHEGSMTTIHANTSRDALSRLESMVAMASLNMPERAVRQQIASAISIVVQVARLSDGTRKVTNISEITGHRGERHQHAGRVQLRRRGIGPDGKVIGSFAAQRDPAEVPGAAADRRYYPADGYFRTIGGGGLKAHDFEICGPCSSRWCWPWRPSGSP